MTFMAKQEDYDRIAVQTKEGAAGSVHETLQEGWKQVIPNYPFNGMFQEELMQESKDVNKNIKQIFTFLSIAALLLSAVGLYALVSLRVLSKTKEIGIRKVVGASIAKVMQVVGKPYSYIVGISIVVGLVAGYYNAMLLMDSLCTQHTGASVEAFLIPVAIILLTAALTVTGKIYQASSQNPARSLRYE